MTPAIHAVTFDVGGTLIDPWPSVGHIYAEVARSRGLTDCIPEDLTGRFLTAWKATLNFTYTRPEWAELVDHTFAGLSDVPPSKTFFKELYERFAQPEAWRIYDDVIPTLDALAQGGLKLGIISNWDERLRPLLTRMRLIDRFEAVVISSEVGCLKPDPKIFLQAARAFAMQTNELLHVGDRLELDILGARAAGLAAVHLRRGKADGTQDEISSLAALQKTPWLRF